MAEDTQYKVILNRLRTPRPVAEKRHQPIILNNIYTHQSFAKHKPQ